MSEFMEKHSVSRIIGAPPGYVGYDEAGQLTEKIRRRPYSVILFDEIEKAHPDVLNIMLQILDDGRITDARGKTVNFENTIIVMTTNAGFSNGAGVVGFASNSAKLDSEKTEKALSTFLRPEFINRVDEVITFRSLDRRDFAGIAKIMLSQLAEALGEKGIKLEFTDEAAAMIADKSFSEKYGARNMRRYIQRNVEDKLAELIISDYSKSFTVARLFVRDGELEVACM
jgi:ATP-dependent Clp protease ATP-binding subunit ClpA